jgi:SAM-dependent methyltransferase
VRWQAKALVQRAIGFLPRAESLNYVLQRRVTHGLPRPAQDFDRHVDEALEHLSAYREHTGRAPRVAYEFGAGWDLIGPLVLCAAGVPRQVLVDIRPNLRLELVNDAIERLRSHQALRSHEESAAQLFARPISSAVELGERFGIDYRAPCDARDTGLAAGSVDLVSSTFTLEHIPGPDIAAILRECGRILAPDGILSCSIDMKDHFSYADDSISIYNFLGLRPRTWRVVNSPLQYQNRLRWRDYAELFGDAGLELFDTELAGPTDDDRRALAAVELAPPFAGRYELEELAVKEARVVARAPA